MAKNDVVLIDGIIEDRARTGIPSNQKDEVFEYFSFEQILKDFDPSREEIESGWVDGRNDGGIDGFFTVVNGYILQDPASFTWPKRNADIDVFIINCKHHDTFQQAPLNSMLASIPEVLDLSSEEAYLRERYSGEILTARLNLLAAYTRLSSVRPNLRFHFFYASRGDSTTVADNVRTRSEQISTVTQTLFSACQADFSFVGAADLISAYRRTKSFSFDLRALELMTTGPGNYVAIVRLQDYFELVTDESGALRRYLFDSNVRDYLGENRVNDDIAQSLTDDRGPEFWWLNNGVTILATGATSAGKILTLHDIQIVNGLQTTESIFRHFKAGSEASLNRGLLVKVVVSSDIAVRDQIIRATNNQSLVEAASLHATDKLQRDIEEILERHGWYYERRKNYYRNIGKPQSRFITPLYIAAGYIALVMKNPAFAARLKSRFMRTQEGYESVFSSAAPLEVWVTITEILKKVEEKLSEIRLTGPKESERFLASWRNLVAFLAVSKILGTFSFSIYALNALNLSKLDGDVIKEIWQLVSKKRDEFAVLKDSRRATLVQACCKQLQDEFGVRDIERVGKQSPAKPVPSVAPVVITDEFIQAVHQTLPAQPWKRGQHLLVIEELKCSKRELASAIDTLISRGLRMRQENGIVFDRDGNVVAVDHERVRPAEKGPPSTLTIATKGDATS